MTIFVFELSDDCVFIYIISVKILHKGYIILYSCIVVREACTHLVSTCHAMTDVIDSLEIIEIGIQERKIILISMIKALVLIRLCLIRHYA